MYDCLGEWTRVYTKGKISLDLGLADGMSFTTHLEVIDAESTYDILLGMDFMKRISSILDSITDEGARSVFEIDSRRFIHDLSLHIAHYSGIGSILVIKEPECCQRKDPFTFNPAVDFTKLSKRIIPDPNPVPRAKELNRVAE